MQNVVAHAVNASLESGNHAISDVARSVVSALGRFFRRQGNMRLRRELEHRCLDQRLKRGIGLDRSKSADCRPSDYQLAVEHLIRRLER